MENTLQKENTIERVSVKEYNGSHRVDTLATTLAKLEEIWGKAHYFNETDYPDDGYKTSVCMGWKNKETGKSIALWDYKNWNYNSEDINPQELISFSIYYENIEDFNTLKNSLNAVN